MMLYPPMADLVDKVGSRYMLVNVVAHRARQLAIKEEDPELATGKKPVSEVSRVINKCFGRRADQ